MAKTSTSLTAQIKPGKPSAASDETLAQFKAALRCATPVIGLTTADQYASVNRITSKVNGDRAFVTWDCCNGFVPKNKLGVEALKHFQWPDGAEPSQVTNPAEAMKVAATAPHDTIIFVLNAHHWLGEPPVIQAVCNIRDVFKGNGCCLVLCAPQLKLAAELAADVVIIDEPLPNSSELGQIVKDIHQNANLEAQPERVHRIVEAVQGVSAFAAEQAVSMALQIEDTGKKDEDGNPALEITGCDIDAVWERKRKKIEQTPGLSVSREGIKFSDLGGLEAIKGFLRDLLRGKARPNCCVWLDELDKTMGGSSGDTSGVSQDQLGTLLSYMQDNKAMGILLVGIPGSGKSALAKATGNEAGVPTVRLDLGAAKGSLVGQSEMQLRDALKVITSVSNGASLWIATCNSLAALPPELRRRFKLGLWYCDLPTSDERKAIWAVHRKAFGIDASDVQPDDTGWTGAEIESCCELAWRLGRNLQHASQFVVPVSQASPDKVRQLRESANARWLSASHPGVYRLEQDNQPMAVAEPVARKMNLK